MKLSEKWRSMSSSTPGVDVGTATTYEGENTLFYSTLMIYCYCGKTLWGQNILELTHSVCVECSDWRRDFFFWDRGIETWDEPRHFGFGRDETRLRHSENVRDLRHYRDTGVKTWHEPKQFNITSTHLHKAHITVIERLSILLSHSHRVLRQVSK